MAQRSGLTHTVCWLLVFTITYYYKIIDLGIKDLGNLNISGDTIHIFMTLAIFQFTNVAFCILSVAVV